jgi:predicted neutral ceramidase superfamily lipid hydrolase
LVAKCKVVGGQQSHEPVADVVMEASSVIIGDLAEFSIACEGSAVAIEAHMYGQGHRMEVPAERRDVFIDRACGHDM